MTIQLRRKGSGRLITRKTLTHEDIVALIQKYAAASQEENQRRFKSKRSARIEYGRGSERPAVGAYGLGGLRSDDEAAFRQDALRRAGEELGDRLGRLERGWDDGPEDSDSAAYRQSARDDAVRNFHSAVRPYLNTGWDASR